ncbi:hypothetical protein BJV82DRAFT_629741 [Fennellomyces sp. T-0311]|nr:hypothetical protein BJV82DRAFT_629741 [Fennellomyces sp. T-0311]
MPVRTTTFKQNPAGKQGYQPVSLRSISDNRSQQLAGSVNSRHAKSKKNLTTIQSIALCILRFRDAWRAFRLPNQIMNSGRSHLTVGIQLKYLNWRPSFEAQTKKTVNTLQKVLKAAIRRGTQFNHNSPCHFLQRRVPVAALPQLQGLITETTSQVQVNTLIQDGDLCPLDFYKRSVRITFSLYGVL